MQNNILIITPKSYLSGGVSAYWSSVLSLLNNYDDVALTTWEIGGHGNNVLGIIFDQVKIRKKIEKKVDFVFLNPSLAYRSFFRDAFFIKQILNKQIPFIVFFHGWNLDFEKKIDNNYIDFFSKTFGQAKKIFVLSENFKDKILEWGYKGEVVVETTTLDATLLTGFHLDSKLENVKTAKKIKILFLARLLREKGIFELVTVFKKLNAIYNNIELTIAGDGKDFSELSKMVENDKNISLIGYVSGQDKINLFRNNHIYCLPSYSEGLPISVLEAMAFCMPVITTPVGGLKDFFEDTKMGYFVKPKNFDDLKDKLKLLLEDKNKIIEMGKYNYTYANKKLLSTVVAERMHEHILSTIINHK